MGHAEQAVESEMKAMFMLARVNKDKHQDLRIHLQNSYTVRRNEHPSNTTELLSMMNNWKTKNTGNHYNYAQVKSAEDDGLTFMQEGYGEEPERDGDCKGVSMVQSRKES